MGTTTDESCFDYRKEQMSIAVHPPSHLLSREVFSQMLKQPGMKLTAHLHVALRGRIHKSIPPLPLYIYRMCTWITSQFAVKQVHMVQRSVWN
jgi:hypothetical protein